jgi:hypothetical protein
MVKTMLPKKSPTDHFMTKCIINAAFNSQAVMLECFDLLVEVIQGEKVKLINALKEFYAHWMQLQYVGGFTLGIHMDSKIISLSKLMYLIPLAISVPRIDYFDFFILVYPQYMVGDRHTGKVFQQDQFKLLSTV